MGCTCSKNKSRTDQKTKDRMGRDISVSSKSAEECRRYVALWDYKKGSNAELSFQKGNVFTEIVEECDAGPEWIFVTQEKATDSSTITTSSSTSSGQSKSCETKAPTTGYVPRNFVAFRGSLETEGYWCGDIGRGEATARLKGKPIGTFMLRARKGGEFLPQYALSVNSGGGDKIKHFKIHCNQNPQAPTYTLAGRSATDIRRLISKFRQEESKTIGCMLANAPPRPPPRRSALSAEVEKNWQEIPRNQIHIENEIGKGFYGVVHRGTWEPTLGVKLQVAVKELKKGVTEGRASFLAEAVAMKNLRHPRLVKLLGVVSTDEPFYIITEFIKEGSLLRYLRSRIRKSQPLEENQLVNISCQVAEGMRYLEEKKVVHRDLAARNVLIQEAEGGKVEKAADKFDVKIADFGLAQMLKSGSTLKERRVVNMPTKWLAPEALTEGKFSSASDVWSFGILLHEIFTHGKEPYEGMTLAATRKFVLEQRKQLPRAPEMPEGIHMLLISCCEFNQFSRPMFQHVHCYLQTFYEKTHYYKYYNTYQKRGE